MADTRVRGSVMGQEPTVHWVNVEGIGALGGSRKPVTAWTGSWL